MLKEKYGWCNASRTVIRCAGSKASNRRTRSTNCLLIWSVGGITSCEESLGEARPVHNWSSYLKRSGSSHVLLALPRSLRLRPVQPCTVLEELGLSPRSETGESIRHFTHDHLHHCEMLQVVMRLIQSDTSVEFNQNAP